MQHEHRCLPATLAKNLALGLVVLPVIPIQPLAFASYDAFAIQIHTNDFAFAFRLLTV